MSTHRVLRLAFTVGLALVAVVAVHLALAVATVALTSFGVVALRPAPRATRFFDFEAALGDASPLVADVGRPSLA